MKKFMRKFFSIAVSVVLLVTSAVPAFATSASGYKHHSGDTNLNQDKQYDGLDKYTITLTDPHDNAVVDEEAKYGAYQIFSGTVKGDTYDDNPGNRNEPIPITDIKWGNAFGTTGEEAWQKNIIKFVFALAKANDAGGEYNYAFDNFDGFDDFVKEKDGKKILNTDYTDGGEEIDVDEYGNVSGTLTKVNFDKLAVAVADVIADSSHANREWLQDFADILGGFESDSSGTATYANESFVNQYYGSIPWNSISNQCTISVPAGYYMILDLSDEEKVNEAYSARMLFVADNITQELKADVPTLDKEIVRDGGEYNTEVAGVGDVVTFKLTGTLPSNYDNFTLGYQYIFTDTLSKGLTLELKEAGVSNVYVTVKAKGVYNQENIWLPTKEITITPQDITEVEHTHKGSVYGYTESYEESTNTLEINFPCLKEIAVKEGSDTYTLGVKDDESSQIYITYKAKVNQNAVVSPRNVSDMNGNKNSAVLTYSNNPQAYDDTAKTTTQAAVVYVFGLDIVKVDAASFLKNDKDKSAAALGDAKFALVRPATGDKWEIAQFRPIGPNPTTMENLPQSFKDNGYYAIISWEEIVDGGGNAVTGTFNSEWLDIATYKGKNEYNIASLSNGALNISGLDAGVTYTMVETAMPTSGDYAKIDPFTIKLEAATDRLGEYTGTLSGAEVSNTVEDNESFSYEEFVQLVDSKTDNPDNDGSAEMIVANFLYTDLPSTGGIGRYLFYILGGGGIALSAALFFLSRRKTAK